MISQRKAGLSSRRTACQPNDINAQFNHFKPRAGGSLPIEYQPVMIAESDGHAFLSGKLVFQTSGRPFSPPLRQLTRAVDAICNPVQADKSPTRHATHRKDGRAMHSERPRSRERDNDCQIASRLNCSYLVEFRYRTRPAGSVRTANERSSWIIDRVLVQLFVQSELVRSREHDSKCFSMRPSLDIRFNLRSALQLRNSAG